MKRFPGSARREIFTNFRVIRKIVNRKAGKPENCKGKTESREAGKPERREAGKPERRESGKAPKWKSAKSRKSGKAEKRKSAGFSADFFIFQIRPGRAGEKNSVKIFSFSAVFYVFSFEGAGRWFFFVKKREKLRKCKKLKSGGTGKRGNKIGEVKKNGASLRMKPEGGSA
jgi:hypothetical protein